METESSLRNLAFLNKNKMMDNVQKHNICINITSSLTFRSYLFSYVDYMLSLPTYLGLTRPSSGDVPHKMELYKSHIRK
jgi:hypothetical protein